MYPIYQSLSEINCHRASQLSGPSDLQYFDLVSQIMYTCSCFIYAIFQIVGAPISASYTGSKHAIQVGIKAQKHTFMLLFLPVNIYFYTPGKRSSFVRSFVRPSVRLSQSLIRYSCQAAEQNFMKLSGIVHYMMPYCTSYFKFLSA